MALTWKSGGASGSDIFYITVDGDGFTPTSDPDVYEMELTTPYTLTELNAVLQAENPKSMVLRLVSTSGTTKSISEVLLDAMAPTGFEGDLFYTDTYMDVSHSYAKFIIANAGGKTMLTRRIGRVGGDEHVELTQAEYDALTTEEKNNGKVYFITDGEGGGGGSDIYIIDTANPPSSNEARLAFAEKRSVYIKHTENYETRFYECLYMYDTEGTTFRAYTIAVPHMFAERIVIRNFWFDHEADIYDVPMVFDRYADSPIGDGMNVSSTQGTKNGSVSFDDGFGNRFSMGRYGTSNDMVRVVFNKTQSGVQVPVTNYLITEDYLGSLVSPNGTKYRLKVADDGTLSTEVAN